MEEIIEVLKKNRPNLTLSSLKTYSYIIKKLLKKMELEPKDFNKILERTNKVLEVLKNETPQTRKTILAVLISLFGRNEKTEVLHNQMLVDANHYTELLKSQKKTDKQEQNWISWNEIVKTYNDLYKQLSPLLKKKPLQKKDILRLVDLIMLAVYVLIPPRRSSDYIYMKVKNYDPDKDNYLDMKKGIFVFNQYKTSKTYNRQEIKLSPKLKTLLKKWVEINPTDYLLFDSKYQPLSPSRLTIKLNNLFDRQISSSMIRHIFISEVVLKDAPKILERENIAKSMAHSIDQQSVYAVA